MLRDFEEFPFRARPSAQRRKPPAWLLRPDRMILKNESASRECGPIPAGRHFRQPSSRPRSSPSFEIIHGTDFYRSFAAFAHGRNPLAPFDGFVQIIALERVNQKHVSHFLVSGLTVPENPEPFSFR